MYYYQITVTLKTDTYSFKVASSEALTEEEVKTKSRFLLWSADDIMFATVSHTTADSTAINID